MTSAPDVLVVSECFGPTWQGEGPTMGRLAGFVRLGRCSLSCVWCDSRFTWDWDRYDPERELRRMPASVILGELDAMGVDMVVVTGGEPLLQQSRLPDLLGGVKARGWRVEIETSGTIAPALPLHLVDQFNVSPKLANSGNPRERRYLPDVLRRFEATGKAVFKFVVCEPDDLDEVGQMVDECGLGAVWVMPEGTDAGAVVARTRRLADAVLASGWNLTTRLHVLIWDDRRGV